MKEKKINERTHAQLVLEHITLEKNNIKIAKKKREKITPINTINLSLFLLWMGGERKREREGEGTNSTLRIQSKHQRRRIF